MRFSIYNLSIIIAVFFVLSSCAKDGNTNAALSSGTGKGGSLSKFTISGDYLYAVDSHSLLTYNISNPSNPVKTNSTDLGFGVETIYPFNNRLFIGTTTGLFIYSIDTPSIPSKLGEARHARSCDPVVANDSIAYVTLKGSSNCGPAESGLYVHDIKNVFQPVLKKIVPISTPEGLGLQGNYLYICCNYGGLKVFNIINPLNPVEVRTVAGEYFKDVIPYGSLLICYVSTGIALYDIANPSNPVLIKLIVN